MGHIQRGEVLIQALDLETGEVHNLTNADAIKRDLFREDRRHINTDSDSEILLNVLAHELQIEGKLVIENTESVYGDTGFRVEAERVYPYTY